MSQHDSIKTKPEKNAKRDAIDRRKNASNTEYSKLYYHKINTSRDSLFDNRTFAKTETLRKQRTQQDFSQEKTSLQNWLKTWRSKDTEDEIPTTLQLQREKHEARYNNMTRKMKIVWS